MLSALEFRPCRFVAALLCVSQRQQIFSFHARTSTHRVIRGVCAGNPFFCRHFGGRRTRTPDLSDFSRFLVAGLPEDA